MTPSFQADRAPDSAAVIMGSTGGTTTYRELDERSTRFARALQSHGLRPGDHIAILMQNHPAYLETAWAAQRSGLYYTAINSHLRTGEVQYILDDCEAVALVSSEAMADAVKALDVSGVKLRVCA